MGRIPYEIIQQVRDRAVYRAGIGLGLAGAAHVAPVGVDIAILRSRDHRGVCGAVGRGEIEIGRCGHNARSGRYPAECC